MLYKNFHCCLQASSCLAFKTKISAKLRYPTFQLSDEIRARAFFLAFAILSIYEKFRDRLSTSKTYSSQKNYILQEKEEILRHLKHLYTRKSFRNIKCLNSHKMSVLIDSLFYLSMYLPIYQSIRARAHFTSFIISSTGERTRALNPGCKIPRVMFPSSSKIMEEISSTQQPSA